MTVSLIKHQTNRLSSLPISPALLYNNAMDTSMRTKMIGALIIGGGALALYFIRSQTASNALPTNRLLKNLEYHLSSQALNLPKEKPEMLDYRRPNEGCPDYILPHLKFDTPGICVTTGSERAFMTLFSCVKANAEHPEFFQGVVCIDVNPMIKCYNDFNVLLLRLSETQEEYQQLSGIQKWARATLPDPSLRNQKPDLKACRTVVRNKLAKDTQIPSPLKKYYVKNFDRLANGYYGAFDLPGEASGAFFSVNYVLDHPEEFAILQQYAREGKFITLVGDINHLSVLQRFQINAIDMSNIYDFTPIQFAFHPTQCTSPRVIWSEPGWMATRFRSAIFPLGIKLNLPSCSIKEENPSYLETADEDRWTAFGPSRRPKN